MSLKDELANLGDDSQHEKIRRSVPKGWEAATEYDQEGGWLVSQPRKAGADPDHAQLLAEFDLNPEKWRITNVRRSKWQIYSGEWLESFRCSFVPVYGPSKADVSELLDIVNRWKPRKGHQEAPQGDLGYVAVLADTQVGKIDGGGSEQIIANVLSAIDRSVDRVKELRKSGRQIGTIYLPQLGDCIEGMNSQGGKNLWRTDLDLTSQIRVYRRLLLAMIKAHAPLAARIVVPVVPGNHDEAVRVGNSMATTYTDSFALDAASAVQDALADREDFAHVSFVFPKHDRMTVTIDACGTIVGFAHGHQMRGKAMDWWAKMGHGMHEIGDATLLVTGHYHHLRVEQGGAKTWMQTPALDGGSTWFENLTGAGAPSGMLSFTIGNGQWDDLKIL